MNVVVGFGSMLTGQRMVRAVLEIDGARLLGVGKSVESLLRIANETGADLVVLEKGVCGGMEIEAIMKLKRLPQRPIVLFVTTCMHELYRTRCFEAGADYVLRIADERVDFHTLIEGLLRSIAASQFEEYNLARVSL
jgi:DNA-binding response OmpR family regulator